ncbi:hypothetical protein JTE90_007378 [Oedothorax gibbosus]|uniref:Transcriptional coactivator p15 (PC4) C-terminal domain-containing protein n=1 Tax=Oedothorax gibbosus TaxID=931172 RepID=A0AAV6TPN7_9ARAC|nr:hypothetical protein JTE90_007378 [Oedothorax gibbosus]
MSKRTFEEASKAMEMSSRAESNMTLANLPQNMIHLGDSQFLVVRSFLGNTRVHIRKFIENDEKELIPTKNGVSLAIGRSDGETPQGFEQEVL